MQFRLSDMADCSYGGVLKPAGSTSATNFKMGENLLKSARQNQVKPSLLKKLLGRGTR